MPAKSRAQMRFMGAIAGGKLKKKGLSSAKAKEFIKGQKAYALPEKVAKKKKVKRNE